MTSYLRHIREKQGLSQYELSEITGIPQAAISKIERGLRKPHMSTLLKLARALHVEQPVMLSMDVGNDPSFDELIEGTPEERSAYLEVRHKAGRFTPFMRNLQRIFDSSIKDSTIDPLMRARLESAFMYGYVQAVADAAQLEHDEHIETKEEEVSTEEPTRVLTESS
jgi:transcriptional regulator with XRE-family HTH domain